MKQIFTLFAILLLSFSFSISQNESYRAAEKAFKKGNHRFKQKDYMRALPDLKEAANLAPDNAKYHYTLGVCLFESWKVRESLPYLERAAKLQASVDEKIHFYYSRALHLCGKYEEAIVEYTKDMERYTSASDPDYWESNLKMQQCSTGIRLSNSSGNFSIENLGGNVNSVWPEYASTYADNYQYMLFTSRRPAHNRDITGSIYLPEDINEEVYESSLAEGGWAKTRRMPKPVHVFRHDASVSISEDGNSLLYYQNRHHGDIYISKKEDGKWTRRKSIGAGINTKKYTEPSCYIAADGNSLFYVSDKAGGFGGRDIYFSKKLEMGTWVEAETMGPAINTEFDEDAPFLSEDGKTFYFASNCAQSMGGFDIFKCSKLPDGSWSKPENLGLPINSPGDDIFFVMRRDGEGFFFSSDRPGGYGDMDIYSGKPGRPSEKQPTVVAGVVADKKTNEPLESTLTLVDTKTREEIKTQVTKAGEGSFTFEIPRDGRSYDLNVKVNRAGVGAPAGNYVAGVLRDEVSGKPLGGKIKLTQPGDGSVIAEVSTDPETGKFMFSLPRKGAFNLEASAPNYDSYLEDLNPISLEPGRMTNLEIGLSKAGPLDKIVLSGAYFNPTQWDLLPGSFAELNHAVAILKRNTNIQLRIVGHTDSDGDEAYNQALSLKRAQAVAKYLTDNGIASERLLVSGAGEKQPQNDNSTPEKKSKNRRVELNIVK